MKKIRLAAAALTAAAAAGLIPATAHASQLPPVCPEGGLYAKLVQPVAVRHPNQKVDLYQPILNTRRTTITNASFNEVISGPVPAAHYAPTIWWRIDKGSWHLMKFTNLSRPNTTPVWVTGLLPLGTFKAHQTHTLELSYSFSPKAHTGWYSGWAEMTPSNNCRGLGMADTTAYYYSNK